MRKFIILLFTIFLSTSISNATCWEQYSTKIFIDTDSIEYYINDYGRTNPEQYTFWIKYLNDGSSLFTNYEKYSHKKVWFILVKNIIDIKKKRLTEKSIIIYDTKKNVLFNSENPDYSLEWQSIAPETRGDNFYDIILEHRNKQ